MHSESQALSSGTVVTQYLLDLQPGLTQMTSFAHARLT